MVYYILSFLLMSVTVIADAQLFIEPVADKLVVTDWGKDFKQWHCDTAVQQRDAWFRKQWVNCIEKKGNQYHLTGKNGEQLIVTPKQLTLYHLQLRKGAQQPIFVPEVTCCGREALMGYNLLKALYEKNKTNGLKEYDKSSCIESVLNTFPAQLIVKPLLWYDEYIAQRVLKGGALLISDATVIAYGIIRNKGLRTMCCYPFTVDKQWSPSDVRDEHSITAE